MVRAHPMDKPYTMAHRVVHQELECGAENPQRKAGRDLVYFLKR